MFGRDRLLVNWILLKQDQMKTRWIVRSVFGVIPVALAVLCVGWPVVSAAQGAPSLVELARQEQARRKAIKVPAKVYTDKDARDTAQAPAPAGGKSSPSKPDATAVPDARPPAGAPPANAEAGEHDEIWWKARMDQAREGLRRNEVFAEALQSQVNGLTTDFVNRDDPYQRAKVGEDRQKAIAELDRVKREIDQAKKVIADIEEEARRAGVPPGWIR
jgi:hypothetical protein